MIDKNEPLFVVDENNTPLESKPRYEVHTKGLWHRVSHVYVINSQGNILVQKRSFKKDSNPGKWEAFFGGHLASSQNELDGAVKEINEELGLKLTNQDLKIATNFNGPLKHSNVDGHIKEFQYVYFVLWDGDIDELHPEADEVDELKWLTPQKVIAELRSTTPNWVRMGHEIEMLTKVLPFN